MARKEVDVGGQTYSLGQLTTFQQLHLSRKIAPLLPPLIPAYLALGDETVNQTKLVEIMEPLAGELAGMPDAQIEYVLATALSIVQRRQGDAWAPVWSASGHTLMFSDIGLDTALRLVYEVIMDQLGPFIGGFLQRSPGEPAEPDTSTG